VALWREALLARHVLAGKTIGYRHHPQLLRFRARSAPLAAIDCYLMAVHDEAVARGYNFDRSKFRRRSTSERLEVTEGQLGYEWNWLMSKLRRRNPPLYRLHRKVTVPQSHPLFRAKPGPVEGWEKV
jgi:hypothetical protein